MKREANVRRSRGKDNGSPPPEFRQQQAPEPAVRARVTRALAFTRASVYLSRMLAARAPSVPASCCRTLMPLLPFTVHERHGYRYIAEGPVTDRPPVVLLHGMLGDLSNWTHSIHTLVAHQYQVFAPVLPVYDLPLKQTSVPGLVTYVRGFVEALSLDPPVLVGNSLGGHVALLYALAYPEALPALVLSGASGIYEVNIGTTTPRRQDREYIRERAAVTFYDPAHATDELVEEMHGIVNDRARALRLIKMARSAKSETIVDRLDAIDTPTLLVWGRDDAITPPDVGKEFLARMDNARLEFIDACGHAPMIEHPERFNVLMLEFLQEVIGARTYESESAS